MDKLNNPSVPVPAAEKSEKSADEQTEQKIHRHLSDKHDEVTEQDIENVRTDIFEANLEEPRENQSPASAGNRKNDKEGGDPPKENNEEEKEKEPDGVPIVTPWSILGS